MIIIIIIIVIAIINNCACCYPEIEVGHQSFYLTQSQHTDTGPTNPSTDPVTSGTCQGSHYSSTFNKSLAWFNYTKPRSIPRSPDSWDGRLTTWPRREVKSLTVALAEKGVLIDVSSSAHDPHCAGDQANIGTVSRATLGRLLFNLERTEGNLVFNQANMGIVSRATLGRRLRDGTERV